MDIVVKGRHLNVSDSFRAHIEDKVSKVEQLAPRALRVEVVITHDANVKHPESVERVEITVVAKGPILRAEACASDKYAALDLAWAKLMERLRRSRDRQKVSRQGKHRAESTAEALAKLEVKDSVLEPEHESGGVVADDGTVDQTGGRVPAQGQSPVVLREKTFPANPIAVDEALNRMEMVGHDFYLFIDVETRKPSVVYRRRGWSYGVIALDEELIEAAG